VFGLKKQPVNHVDAVFQFAPTSFEPYQSLNLLKNQPQFSVLFAQHRFGWIGLDEVILLHA